MSAHARWSFKEAGPSDLNLNIDSFFNHCYTLHICPGVVDLIPFLDPIVTYNAVLKPATRD